MKQIFTRILTMAVLVMSTLSLSSQQLPDPGFENWTGDKFNGEIQLKDWHASNVEQVGFKFNFAHQEKGHSGSYCLMVKDQEVGAAGITEPAPGYAALGTPWQYLPGITQINSATAGTSGGISFTYRPDSMVVWVKRTGDKWSSEDFHLLFYSWKGTAKGTNYKAKNGSCTSHSETDEESDVRLAMNGNECGTVTKATQIAEGWLRDRKEYTNWTRLTVPIYYLSDEAPQKCNVILSAGNYPNFRANSGLNPGNSLYADDIELIYSSKIQQLYIGGKIWNGFDPNSTEVQTYSVGHTTVVPEVYAVRGAGSLTNTKGVTVNFPGRRLSGDEISITYGKVDGDPTVITVKSNDKKSTTTYKIKMVQAPSENATLKSILVNGEEIKNYTPQVGSYNVALPYGTTATPVVSFVKAEEQQDVKITQATSTTGTATLVVTAADGKTKKTYTLKFSVALLSDNTLENIKVNGEPIPDFIPTLTTYKVELPLETTKMPTIEAVSKYPKGEQTIVYTAPEGSAIDGAQYKVSVTTPGNKTAKVYKLNFRITASSNSKLKDLRLMDGDHNYIENFNPDVKSYYATFPVGTTKMPTIEYTMGDKYQTVDVVDGGLDGTSSITVTAASGAKTVYKIMCQTERSDISYLSMIYLDGTPLEGFSSTKYKYTVTLPTGAGAVPEITYKKGDELQTVRVDKGGLNASSYLFVTADDGSTSLYEIYFKATLADVSTLDMITIGGENLDGFNPDKTEYTYPLPQGTTELPEISYTKHDDWQIVSIRSNGVNGDTKITVRSQAGTQTVYVLHFTVTTSSNTTLKSVSFDGKPYAGFEPSKRDYVVDLDEGVSEVPAVTFDQAEPSQKVVKTLEGTTYTIRVIAEDGTQGVYTITFNIQKSDNAFLKMIYLDGVELEGFDPQNFKYSYELNTPTCPTITVDKEDSTQHVLITAPAATGKVSIVVTPEAGASNTYTINITSDVRPQLAGISINEKDLEDFSPTTYAYEVTYSGALPEVGYTPQNPAQKITMVTDAKYARIYVEAGGEKAMYELEFKPTYSDEARLQWIAADGDVDVLGYDKDKFDYSLPLPEDGHIPVITYKTNEPAQHVVAGLDGPYVYKLHVFAESGATKTYTITFTTGATSDTELEKVTLDGNEVTFDKNNTATLDIDQGKDLPKLDYETRDGQSVISAQTSDLQQQLIVVAEDGTTDTYTVNYTKNTDVDNALLNDIRVLKDGKWRSVDFDENTFEYDITLPRGTLVAPCVWPVAGKPGQEITVTYGSPDGATIIHVEAKNGEKQDYTIHCSVTKSTNSQLSSLEIDGQKIDLTKLTKPEIKIERAFGEIEPLEIVYTKAKDSNDEEEDQLIEFVSAPVTGTSKIIVTAEDRLHTTTYLISCEFPKLTEANKLKSISYSYTTAGGTPVYEVINDPTPGSIEVNLPFGAKEFKVEGYEKNYPEQAVVFYDGGIRRGATLIVSANREGAEDVSYTIVPVMPEFEQAGKLKELKFKGVLVPNFRPDVYNYIVNVTEQPIVEDFSYDAYNNNNVTPPSIDAIKKQITFTVTDGETYSVCWFYQNDGKYLKNGSYYDYLDFSQDWVATPNVAMWKATWTSSASATSTKKSTGFKPQGWTVPADLVAGMEYEISLGGLIGKVVDLFWYTGKEVIAAGTNGAMLSTINGASINGSVPGMMTLGGTMALTPGKSGGSKSSITYTASNYIQMRNTPDSLSMRYKSLSAQNISEWYYELKTIVGTNTVRTNKFPGNYDTSAWRYASLPITEYTDKAMAKYALTINSAATANANDMGGSNTIYSSDLQIENVHFVYNSDLTAVTVNGKSTEKSGNTFTYTLGENEDIIGVPAMKFTGKVHDQMQVISVQNNGEWVKGDLTYKVTNFGENSIDSTVYYVVLHRDPETSLDYTLEVGAEFAQTVSNDTTYYNMPYGTQLLPDFTIKPSSTHQRFNIAKNGNAVTITVTNENKESKTNVYVFREVKSNNTSINALKVSGLTPTFDPNITDYTIAASVMPEVEVTKGNEDLDYGLTEIDLGQTIDLNYTDTGAIVTVTAPDGVTTKVYTIHFTKTLPSTEGKLRSLTRNNESVSGFAYNKYEYNERMSENIGFERWEGQEMDTIVETITDKYVSVAVKGTADPVAVEYKITYPTELSDNAQLDSILIKNKPNSEFMPYSEFMPQRTNYTYETDEPVDIKFILAEPTQKMEITIGNSSDASGAAPRRAMKRAGTTVFTVKVFAENGDSTVYTFTLAPESSPVNTLAGISINGTSLADFYPEKKKYTYVIPSATPKIVEPDLPSIAYTLGNQGQTVEVISATKVGETTSLIVTPENGNALEACEYQVTFTAEPSHNAELKNILVNGNPVSGFKPSRTNYSMQVFGDETAPIEFAYTTGDPFQTVQITDMEEGNGKQLQVTAQDGITKLVYEVEIWRAAKSNNANLANILFNNKPMATYAAIHDIDGLYFDENIYRYSIPLARTDTMPDIAVRLQEDAQTIEIASAVTSEGTLKTIHVTAEDGESTKEYKLLFELKKSDNTQLSMILVKADSLKGFEADKYDYDYYLPIGEKTIPAVDAFKSENVQNLDKLPSEDGMRVSLVVTAENKVDKATYTVTFHYTYSELDKLMGIYEGEDLIEGFRADSFYYAYTLPMGVRTVPMPIFEPGDIYQHPQLIDTIRTQYRTTYQCKVTAHDSLHTQTYTVVYDIQPSNVDTLRSIHVDVGLGKRPLEGFRADELNYTYIIPKEATQSPTVEVQLGDSYQDTTTTFVGDMYRITVTAENGRARTYSIRFENERSNDATLLAIYIGASRNNDINFDPEEPDYEVALPYGTTEIPLVTFLARDGQQCVMAMDSNKVTINVTAEDGVTTLTYTLTFVPAKSSNASLASITIGGEPLAEFLPDQYEYKVLLPYGTTEVPEVVATLADSTATMEKSVDNLVVTISTQAADEKTLEYVIVFEFEGCPISYLNDITIKGVSLEGFDKDSTNYTIAYPAGSDESIYAGVDDIAVVKGDPTQTVTVTDDYHIISITVEAQNGDQRVYIIRQIIPLHSNSLLADLQINGATIANFADTVFNYEYLLFEGEVMPAIEATAQDSLTSVDITPGKIGEEPTVIFCTAEDGSESKYYITWVVSPINTAQDPGSGDVLFKTIPGSDQFVAYTIRNNTWFAVYDHCGRQMFNVMLPVCNPNEVDVVLDHSGHERIIDAHGEGMIFSIPTHGQTFFYYFYSSGRRIGSGKFMVQ